ncbi:hypothetical protein CDO52_09080 [Nocardiopsis gilva YIM 90087]|uniref:Sporulation protein n=1 Tax=Nocardiopsis gilva YIM 90087 TaxID=1235441 RepID=A0A223S491_9ACTN|nr:spore germination protein GerW family protein [Nocardiopsis gilva]ASU82921.1 hypothetical protein CDO52_09080 [Nocardiopsis gilva YIM 90087]
MNELDAPVNGGAGQRGAAPAIAWLDRVNARLGGTASVSAVFGDPIECDGVTVIPVARIRFGVGGGAGAGNGRNRERGAEGGTTGGLGTAGPVGYIEVKDGAAAFKSIGRPASSLIVPLAAIAGATAVLTLRTILRRSAA